jgi:hypothetical protein
VAPVGYHLLALIDKSGIVAHRLAADSASLLRLLLKEKKRLAYRQLSASYISSSYALQV